MDEGMNLIDRLWAGASMEPAEIRARRGAADEVKGLLAEAATALSAAPEVTSPEVAAIASRAMAGQPMKATEIKAMAASCLAQAPAPAAPPVEVESVEDRALADAIRTNQAKPLINRKEDK